MRNRQNWLARAALIIISGLPALALAPIATVTTAEPFMLDGHMVTVLGMTSVPLAVGHEISTSNMPIVLFFSDGSSVKLGAGSRARLTGSDMQPKLILLAGSLDYKVVLGSNLSVTSLDLERRTRPVAGRVMPPPAKTLSTPHPSDATLSVVTR